MASALTLLSSLIAMAQTAPDATPTGPSSVTSSEYKRQAVLDPDVLASRVTEIWARVYRPTPLPAGPRPLVIFLHGNHQTCGTGVNPRIDDRMDYTNTGTCPNGYVVTPNHEGFAYLASKLASWGYIVVSINTNRGINGAMGISGDVGLNLVRGRLVLKHLQWLSEWNRNGGTPSSVGVELKGHLDLGNVAMMGHSRGGEGVRAAYNQYRAAASPWPAKIVTPVVFKTIFEIAPVDGQTSQEQNADGTKWVVLLPMCDGDVFDLQGIHPFDRMIRFPPEAPPRQKAALAIWGANHNFYNTEWQTNESGGCNGHMAIFPPRIGSPSQQATALHAVLALIRGNVGAAADPAFNKLFNPRFLLPPALAAITPIERSLSDATGAPMRLILDDFDKPTGTSSAGAQNEFSRVAVVHTIPGSRHDRQMRAALMSWNAAGPNTFFQTNFTAPGLGRDLSRYLFLNLRVARQDSNQNPPTPLPTNFKVQLVDATGNKSTAVPLNTFLRLTGPVGGPPGLGSDNHVLLQTVQIPLARFGAFDLNRLRGVRLVFDDTPTGEIFVANIRFSNSQTPETVAGIADLEESSVVLAAADQAHSQAVSPAGSSTGRAAAVAFRTDAYLGGIVRLRAPAGVSSAAGRPLAYEIEVRSRATFPARNELVKLRLGDRILELSHYPDSGETSTLLFPISEAEFAMLSDGAEAVLFYGDERHQPIYKLGRLNKSLIH